MTSSNARAARLDPLAFLAGGGEMGERTRAFDWSNTPVGPVAEWQHSLRTAVSICLGSRYPIVMWWGHSAFTTFYNDAYMPIFGVTKHPRSLGRPGWECWSDIWPIIGPMLEGVLATGEATWSEDLLLVMHRNRPREEAYFTFSYSPIRDDTGGVGGVFCAVTETTGRVIGERRLRTLRDLGRTVAQAKEARNACEIAARTLAANPADIPFALIYLIDAEARHARLAAVCGLQDAIAWAPDRIDLAASPEQTGPWPLRQVFETGAAELVADLMARFGPLLGGAWLEAPEAALILPIAAPGQTRPTGFLVTGLNPQRVVDADYRSFLDLIAGHVGTAIANARAYEEERRRTQALVELDLAKTAFFSNVSHEFRTPLTLMLGPVEDMLARNHRELSPAIAAQLEVVNRNGLRLLRLVNTLLDFSRIEAGRVQAVYQPTDLAAFTAELASVFRSACERAGLRLAVDCPKLVARSFVDRAMWEKIVLNLLSNAFKFTLEGEIEVRVRQAGNDVELQVRDTGTGIAAEEMPRLFERFHRVENAQGRTHEGSGIGLALVQELVNLHGGSIAAESVVGNGTTFTVVVLLGSAHLPSDQIEERCGLDSAGMGASLYVEEGLRWLPDELRDDYPAYVPAPSLQTAEQDQCDDRPYVLVADDNADMRQYIGRLLGQHYRIDAVPDGEAALAAAWDRTPDLILTDVMMPRLDGFGLLRALRADPRTSAVPVIMLSARAGEDSRVEGMQAGADDYLVKPFSARELLARVTAHLKIARVRQETSDALQQSHARFEALFNAAPIGIYLVDADMRIRQVNPKARPVFGDIEGLIGGDFVKIIHFLWPQRYGDELVERFRLTLETGVPYFSAERIEERLDRKVVEYYEWQLHRISLPDGQYGVVCYFSDISRHVLAQRALVEADRLKDEFLATLAHELRNPLAPLRNGLQVMKLANSAEAIEQVRAMMERQLNQMVRLVDDLFDVSRISQGKIELKKERVELAKVVQQAVENSRSLIDQASHELLVNVPPDPIYMDADIIRLTQVFTNLLNNAAKYTERGGRIWLTVERERSDAVVMVRDNGVGISVDMLPKVFELFTQVDRSLEKSQGGLGIGLSLVKGLVEMHGGTVEARSDGLGAGSEFVVRVPVVLKRVGELQDDGGAEPKKSNARRRILIVDDNCDGADSLALMLRLRGNDTQTAYDGLEAVEVAAVFRPDLVLLDIGMPKLNGYDTARRLRDQPGGRNIMLVALTGWGQEQDRRKSHEAGFDLHMVKPIEAAALEKLLAGHEAETA